MDKDLETKVDEHIGKDGSVYELTDYRFVDKEACAIDAVTALPWQSLMHMAFSKMLQSPEVSSVCDSRHLANTPSRLVRMYSEIFWGLGFDPKDVLSTNFEETGYDQMIGVLEIDFTSWCMHHLLPFSGKVHFSYIPRGKVIGLSKVPRLVDILAARPQVQERLTQDIVNIFTDVVNPLGCGCMILASHSCTAHRGVRKPGSVMRTTALRGVFQTSAATKQEFLSSIK